MSCRKEMKKEKGCWRQAGGRKNGENGEKSGEGKKERRKGRDRGQCGAEGWRRREEKEKTVGHVWFAGPAAAESSPRFWVLLLHSLLRGFFTKSRAVVWDRFGM